MCLSENRMKHEVAFNENGKVKYGEKFHKNYKIPDSELQVWQTQIVDNIEPFGSWLHKQHIPAFPIVSLCYLATSTDLQLERVWFLAARLRAMTVEEQNNFQPAKLRADLIKEIEEPKTSIIMKHLRKFDKYITDKMTLEGRWNTSQFVHNRLQASESEERAYYESCPQM